MEAQQWWMTITAFALGAGSAWGAARWWLGRKLRAVLASRKRVEHARQLASQQAEQARKQIEQLQTELSALRLSARRRGQHVEAQPSGPISLPIFEDSDPPDQPDDGFAQTQIMPNKA